MAYQGQKKEMIQVEKKIKIYQVNIINFLAINQCRVVEKLGKGNYFWSKSFGKCRTLFDIMPDFGGGS